MANINNLKYLESIRKKRMQDADIKYLKIYASKNKIYEFVYPKSPADFSRAKTFFTNNKYYLTFVKNGKEIAFDLLDQTNTSFIAFQTKNHKLMVYAYFPNERD